MANIHIDNTYRLVMELSRDELIILRHATEIESDDDEEQRLADAITKACKQALAVPYHLAFPMARNQSIEDEDEHDFDEEEDVDSAVLREAERIVQGRRTKRVKKD